jgi:hypothetical protein
MKWCQVALFVLHTEDVIAIEKIVMILGNHIERHNGKKKNKHFPREKALVDELTYSS